MCCDGYGDGTVWSRSKFEFPGDTSKGEQPNFPIKGCDLSWMVYPKTEGSIQIITAPLDSVGANRAISYRTEPFNQVRIRTLTAFRRAP